MSTVETFLIQTMTISRPAQVTSAEATTSYSTKYSNVPCLLQPVDDVSQLLNPQAYGKEFKLFCLSSVDIQAGDQITVDSIVYGVNGVSSHVDLLEDDNFKQSRVTKNG